MKPINWKITTTLCCSLILVSCGSSDDAGPQSIDGQFDGLRIVGDKETFSASIKEALLNSLSGTGGTTSPATDELAAPTEPLPTGAPANAESDTGGSGDDSSLQVTETNVQELGVDESDRIKSDGRYLYVLNKDYHGMVLPAVEPAPAPAVEPEALTNRLSLPYEPDGRAVIRVLSLDSDAADASELNTIEIDTRNQRADGLYLHQTDSQQSLIVTTSSMSSYWGYWGSPIEFLGEKSTVYKIDVADPANASTGDSLSLDGQIVASRRIGDYLYVATRFFPWLEGIVPQTDDPQSLQQTINDTPIEEFLPQARRESDGSVQALADASNCFVAEKGGQSYYSPDIVTLAVIDLRSLAVSDSVCYLGASDTLYASTNSIYLATNEWNHAVLPVDTAIEVDPSEPDSTSPAVPLPEPIEPVVQTAIHQFDIDGGSLSYVGSGKIDGHLGWDPARKPYRMGEKDGYLRVVSYGQAQDSSQSPVSLSILKPGSGQTLNLVATLPNASRPEHIGKPGEELYASRYMGDKVYLVTFRQIDPLYVIDLANPEDPYIAGALEIPGYSDYLRPIGSNHLLGIGRGAIPAQGQDGDERGAFAQGVKISLFDVSDPASPGEVQSIEIGKRGSWSNALRNPHAITVLPGADGQPARLAIGIDVHDIPSPYSEGPASWYEWRETGLFGFEIRTDANAGISEHGKMIVESRSAGQDYGPLRGDDRSVMVNDSVFYIHGEQVFAANWNSLGNFNGPR